MSYSSLPLRFIILEYLQAMLINCLFLFYFSFSLVYDLLVYSDYLLLTSTGTIFCWPPCNTFLQPLLFYHSIYIQFCILDTLYRTLSTIHFVVSAVLVSYASEHSFESTLTLYIILFTDLRKQDE